jgi:PAS domain S-box-containing protein
VGESGRQSRYAHRVELSYRGKPSMDVKRNRIETKNDLGSGDLPITADWLLHLLPYGAILHHVDGTVIDLNAEAKRLMDLVGERWLPGTAAWEGLLDRSGITHVDLEGERPISDEGPSDEPQAGGTKEIPKILHISGEDGSVLWLEVTTRQLHRDSVADEGIALTTLADITGRMNDRAELESAKRQHVGTLNSINDGYFTLDRQWRFAFVNAQGEAWLRHPTSELVGKRILDVFPDLDGTSFLRTYEQAMDQGAPSTVEGYFAPFDSWFEVRAYPTPEGIAVSFLDITDRKRLEEINLNRERRQRLLLEAIPDRMFLLDRDGRFRFVQVKDSVRLVVEPGVLIGKTIQEVLPADVASMLTEAFRQAFDSDELETIEYPIDLGSGLEDFEARLVRSGDNELMALVRDVTAIKKTERALATSEARYKALVEQAPLVIYTESVDEPRLLTYVSPYVETLLGHVSTDERTDHLTWEESLHPADRDRVLSLDRATDESGEQFAVEYRLLTKDGRVVWVRDVAELVRDQAGHPVCWQGVVTDITARKQAEEALAISEAQFRALVEQVPAVIYTERLDEAGTLEYVSPHMEAILGFPADMFVADPDFWREQVHIDDRHAFDLVEENARVTGEQCAHLYRMTTQDGRIVWVHDVKQLVRDDEGKPIWWQGVVRDVTERKQAEEQLRASQAQLAEAQRIAQVGSWEWHVPSGTLNWSAEIYRLHGLTRDSDTPTFESFMNLVHPDDRERVRDVIESALLYRTPYEYEYRAILPDGTERIIHVLGTLMFDAFGRPVTVKGTSQNVTEQKRIEDELVDSVVRLYTILTQLTEGVMITDSTGRIVFLNDAARQLLGTDAINVSLKDFIRIYRVTDIDGVTVEREALPHAIAMARGEIVSDRRVTFTRADGNNVIAEVNAAPVVAPDGSPLCAVLTLNDVTSRVGLERYKDEFFGNISQELRTPLAEIKTSIGVVLANVPPGLPAPLERLLQHVDDGVDRMAALVESLLELTKLQAGPGNLHLTLLDLSELVKKSVRNIMNWHSLMAK